MSELNTFEQETLDKPTLALHVFSDTLTDEGDYDAEITTDYRHLRPQDTRHGIDNNLTLGTYGVELIHQLKTNADEEIAQSIARAEALGRKPHQNVLAAEQKFKEGTVRVIANSAPRTDEHKNGENFYLAVTENGVEIYATPLDVLTYIKDKVVSLFEIPNEGNPVFNGNREQFRSSIIARVCEHPEHLKRVDPKIIPEQKNPFEIAYVDKFGNIRLRAKDQEVIRAQIEEAKNEGYIGLKIAGISEIVKAKVVSCLDEIHSGQFGIYQNVADGNSPGYFELVRKWSDPATRENGHEAIGSPRLGSNVEIVSH